MAKLQAEHSLSTMRRGDAIQPESVGERSADERTPDRQTMRVFDTLAANCTDLNALAEGRAVSALAGNEEPQGLISPRRTASARDIERQPSAHRSAVLEERARPQRRARQPVLC